MINMEYLLLFAGMGLVTYVPRWFPLFFLTRRQLPGWFVDWLDLIPVAILSALIVPELFTAGTPRHLVGFNARILVAVPTFAFALKTRSLGGTVVVGMALYWIATRWI
jgi:branched-subunit amino acid transport protein